MGEKHWMPAAAKREPIPWGRFFPATVLLASSFASCALVVAAAVWVRGAEAFYTRNEAADSVRSRTLILLLLSGTLAVLFASAVTVLGRAPGTRFVHRLARMAAPMALLWAIQMLAFYKPWREHVLEFLVLLSLTVLAFERALRSSLSALPAYVFERVGELHDRLPVWLRRALPWLIVGTAACSYTIFTAYWSIMQHRRLATAGYDLGIYDNLMYNTIAGHPFRSPVLYGSKGGNYIANHAEFGTLLFTPFYALSPRADTLLIFQSMMIGLAAIPLYAFAKTQLPRWSAALISLAYLLYAPLHGANFYDFHWLTVTVFFVFSLFWAIATHRNILTWVLFLVLISFREDIPVDLAFLGVFLIGSRARVALGTSMTLLAAMSFVLIKFLIMPSVGKWWFANMYQDLIPKGHEGYRHIVQTVLINPGYFISTLLRKEKLLYALHLFAPLAFLPARRAILLIGASGGFYFTLMTTNYGPTLDIAFQYSCHWAPYLFGASVIALRWLGQDEVLGSIKRRAALGALCLGVGLHSLTFGCILQRSNFIGGFAKIPFKITAEERARYTELQGMIARIPPTASVAATDPETPHVSNRMTTYTLNLDGGDADYLLIGRASLGIQDARANARKALERNPYALVAKSPHFVLLRRGSSTPETAPVLKELDLTPETAP